MFGCLNFDTLRAHEAPFDTVAHYIRCPILNYIVCKALGKFTRISPEQWLGVGYKPPSSPITTCVAFTVYHGIKLSHLSSVREAIENGKELDPSVPLLPLFSAPALTSSSSSSSLSSSSSSSSSSPGSGNAPIRTRTDRTMEFQSQPKVSFVMELFSTWVLSRSRPS